MLCTAQAQGGLPDSWVPLRIMWKGNGPGHLGPQVIYIMFNVRTLLKKGLDERSKVIGGCEGICGKPAATLEFLCQVGEDGQGVCMAGGSILPWDRLGGYSFGKVMCLNLLEALENYTDK